MDLIANQMAMDLSFSFELSKITSHNPLKINFRCPLCGDSKEAHKYHVTRGWFYEYENKLRFGCFNCNKNFPFPMFLELHYPDLYREYLVRKCMESGRPTVEYKEPELDKFNKKMPVIEHSVIDEYCTRVDLLPVGHPALTYMQNRMIPADKLKLFWFTMEWRKLTNAVNAGTYSKLDAEPRIVIPIFDNKRQICSMQGRALRKSDTVRYLTIKASEDANKVFGLERIDDSKDVFYLEGPIDSVFIDNALAIVGGTMSLEDAPYKKKRVWVLDNEPRSVDTCKRLKKIIDAGERVVLWDRSPWHKKDVNDMIQKEGATVEQVNQYLRENIVDGLLAVHRFNNWCKVKL